MAETDPAWLFDRARAGDETAWTELVGRFERLVWAVVRSFRLDDGSASDVFQTTWMQLMLNLDRIERPDRLGSWLATTARRESLKAAARAEREVVAAEIPVEHPTESLDAQLIEDEQRRELWAAYVGLSDDCRRLLRLLVIDELTYEEVGQLVDRPHGSLGPMRRRCLQALQRRLTAAHLGGIDHG